MWCSFRKRLKKFEALVERLHRAFHPNAIITRNDHISGRESGRSREINISIRYRLGATDLLIIVDCKRWIKKVDLPEMHSFVGVKSDVGAHAGIVVSEKGFTKPAARIASNNNVQIFTFQDTRNADWQCRLSVPLFVEEWVLVPTVFRLTRKDGLTTDITDDRTISLTDSKTGQGVVAAASVRRLWEEGSDKRPGDVCYDFPVGANASLLEDRLQIGFEARLRRYTRWASLALVGLTDVASGLTYTDELKLEARAEPEVVHSDHANFPSVPGWSFGVMVQTTAVKTVHLERSGLNLKNNPSELTVRSST